VPDEHDPEDYRTTAIDPVRQTYVSSKMLGRLRTWKLSIEADGHILAGVVQSGESLDDPYL
jgi:hypothetical protein